MHDTTSLQQLEFPRIIEKLQSLLSTPFGHQEIERLEFSGNREVVEQRLQEVHQMLGLIEAGEYIPLSGFADIRPYLDQIKPEDAYLEAEALLRIKGDFQLMGELMHFFREHQEQAPLLWRYARGVHYHRNIVREIEATIDPTGEIYDDATPELRQIRKEIRTLEAEQKRMLATLQKRYAEYSQDEIVTLRDGRMVLGILPSQVSKVNGIVHGTSASGATVFVEPMETLQIGNRIQNLRIQERTEIIKILRFLTGLIRGVRDDVYYALENIAALDWIYARAQLARELQAAVPRIAERRKLKISQGRHPLLILKMGYEQVVPLNLEMGESFTTLVITGPNAGGKTVALKTVGLLMLMVQAGIPIPVSPDSEIPLLPRVLVDIGDRQSLEQDLSTFSAHIVRLKEILEQADSHSLVLIDEIGTGTDPREGSALAIALLSELTDRNVLTIATTHHGELKAFAHSHPRVENASMEFDLTTLQPTYRLRVGVPGSSYAFEIARRYGLPDALIEKGRQLVGEQKDRLERLLLDLEQRIQQLDRERRELSIKLSEAEATRKLYENRLEELKKRGGELKRQAAEEAQQIIRRANALIEQAVREIRESQASREAIKTARETIREQKQELENILKATGEPVTPSPPTFLRKGDTVIVESLGEKGELLEDTRGKSKVRVLVGNVKLTVDIAGLRKADGEPVESSPIHKMTGSRVDAVGPGVGPELDLRGLDAEQAIEETDRYLDQALEQGWEEVRIIHGKGTGVLRRRVNEFLSRDKRVLQKRLGKWGEGDTGVTVVKLRRE